MPNVLITGADRGLGFSLSQAFARAGWQVFAGRFLSQYGLLDDLKKEFPLVHPILLDVAKREDILSARDYVKKTAGALDMVVSNAAYMGGPNNDVLLGENPLDLDLLAYSYQVNTLGAIELMEIMLPLLEKGDGKRMCFVSSEVSSVSMMHRDGGFRYTMSKTALNLGARMLYNTLFEKGYTFRLYQPGWMRQVQPDGSRAEGGQVDPDDSAAAAFAQFTQDRPDEQRFVLVGNDGREWPF